MAKIERVRDLYWLTGDSTIATKMYPKFGRVNTIILSEFWVINERHELLRIVRVNIPLSVCDRFYSALTCLIDSQNIV